MNTGITTLISQQEFSKTFTIKEFLDRNLVPFQYYEVGKDDEALHIMKELDLQSSVFPIVIFPDKTIKIDPDLFEVAHRIGLHKKPKEKYYDLAIMGAGPAGLTSAVYGGSEGLKTVVIERHSPGGRAGSTSLIENLIAHPHGITGTEFSERSREQAEKFGVEFVAPVEVNGISEEENKIKISLSSGVEIYVKCLIIAVGVRYRLLEVPGAERLTGSGVYYGAARTEGIRNKGKDVYVVGGANSAGQAAMYFSKFASNVNLIVRANSINKRMSHYLVEEIRETPNIHVMGNSEIVRVNGDKYLESIDIQDVISKGIRTEKADNLFLLIGGVPYTACMTGTFLRDDNGFLVTGTDLKSHPQFSDYWSLKRKPFSMETNIPGVFAVGNVRCGSVKRLAAAIGDGATAVSEVHQFMATPK